MDEGIDEFDGTTRDYLDDPRRAYDALRDRCPLARSAVDGSWMVLGHAEVRRCASDAEAFSNRASARLQLPNGLDGAEHLRMRAATDGILMVSRRPALRATLRGLAEELIGTLPRQGAFDAVWQLGAPLAVRFQSAWLGWPSNLERTLLDHMNDHRAAMRGGEPGQLAAVADRFDAIVREQISLRRGGVGAADGTGELVRSMLEDPQAPGGRRLFTDAEVVSILRNWTAGDLGTIAACVGVVVHRVATDDALQSSLRAACDQPGVLERAIDECLRIDDPFLWNRRVTTRPVDVAGRTIPAGVRVVIHWAAANRDPRQFAQPDAFRPDEHAADNLTYGVGPHACPGRELATLQLRETLQALLRLAPSIRLAARPSPRAHAPMGGYEHVWVVIDS